MDRADQRCSDRGKGKGTVYDNRIKWLTIICFEMQFGGTTVVSDPCTGASPGNDLTWEDIENCDIITPSHCYWDHITDIPTLMDRFPAPLLTGTLTAMPMLRWLNCNPGRIYPMGAGLELDFGEVKSSPALAVAARWHSTVSRKWKRILRRIPSALPVRLCSICRSPALWNTGISCSPTKREQNFWCGETM